MIHLNFPYYKFRINNINKKYYIFCIIRNKFLLLTKEEWVRQHVIQFLIKEKKYPSIYIYIENTFLIGKRKKRIDILVYKKGKPFILIECKSPYIKITQNLFDQINIYNSFLNSRYLMITNGIKHLVFQMKNKTCYFLNKIPYFHD